eukprot:GHVT01069743.1.p1 GENE.GHVT01069743.1~~GHVT01069743.1.p1  ORF type:complete len:219 (+),score=26.63 GHVT01069743.1:1017-1673(+)
MTKKGWFARFFYWVNLRFQSIKRIGTWGVKEVKYFRREISRFGALNVQMIIQRVLQEQAALQAALGATLSHHGAEKEGILTDRGMHTASGLSSASVASSTPPLGSASKRQPQASEGAQRLLPSTFISEQHLLLWRIVGRVCYTLVVDACENPLLASSFLILLGAFSRALLAPAGGTTDVAVNKAMQPDYEQEALMFATRPDVILAILHFLLPGKELAT